MFAPLLDRVEDLTATVVTGDQLHTQRAHATYLHQRGAHYVFTVGGNQPRLFAALDALPWQQIAIDAEQAFLLERYIYGLDGTPLGAVAVLGVPACPPPTPTPQPSPPTSGDTGQ
jgi:hypothetical protein